MASSFWKNISVKLSDQIARGHVKFPRVEQINFHGVPQFGDKNPIIIDVNGIFGGFQEAPKTNPTATDNTNPNGATGEQEANQRQQELRRHIQHWRQVNQMENQLKNQQQNQQQRNQQQNHQQSQQQNQTHQQNHQQRSQQQNQQQNQQKSHQQNQTHQQNHQQNYQQRNQQQNQQQKKQDPIQQEHEEDLDLIFSEAEKIVNRVTKYANEHPELSMAIVTNKDICDMIDAVFPDPVAAQPSAKQSTPPQKPAATQSTPPQKPAATQPTPQKPAETTPQKPAAAQPAPAPAPKTPSQSAKPEWSFDSWLEKNEITYLKPLLTEYGFNKKSTIRALNNAALDAMSLTDKKFLGVRCALLAAVQNLWIFQINAISIMYCTLPMC